MSSGFTVYIVNRQNSHLAWGIVKNKYYLISDVSDQCTDKLVKRSYYMDLMEMFLF